MSDEPSPARKVGYINTGSTHRTPEGVLEDTLAAIRHGGWDLEDVLLVAMSKDGQLMVRTSTMTRERALWLARRSEDWTMYELDEHADPEKPAS